MIRHNLGHSDTGTNMKLKENLKCEKCNCGFRNKGSLEYHICESMPGLQQLYKCPKCDNINKHGLFITHYKVIYLGVLSTVQEQLNLLST